MKTKLATTLTLLLTLFLTLSFATSCNGGKSNSGSDDENDTTIVVSDEERADISEEVDPLMLFFFQFINDCFYDKDFYSMLMNRAPNLEKYLTDEIEIKRVYAPGSAAYLYGREDNFGLLEENFVVQSGEVPEYQVIMMSEDEHICDLDLESFDTFYYQFTEETPQVVTNPETLEFETIQFPYPITEKRLVVLYAPRTYGGPESFYFLNIDGEWKLVLIQDSLCSA